MEKPPLVLRTKVITSLEDEMLELQRDNDAEYYEAKINKAIEKIKTWNGEVAEQVKSLLELS